MAEAVLERNWRYPLTNVSSNRSVPRAAVDSLCSQLTGIDGQLRGGLRPFPGLDLAYELDFQEGNTNHNTTSKVLDCVPVSFRRDSTTYAYGFVYRVQRSFGQSGLSDVFLDYYDTEAGTWRTGSDGNVIAEGVPNTGQMDVAVYGRLCYVFIEGRSPVLFYIELDDEPDDPDVVGSTSSGSPPSSSSSSSSAGAPTLRVVGKFGVPPVPGPGLKPGLVSPDSATALGSIFTTDKELQPSKGQVVLTGSPPSESGLYPDLEEDNPFLYGGPDSSILGADGEARVVFSSQPTHTQLVESVTVTDSQAILVFISSRTQEGYMGGVSFEVWTEQGGSTVDTGTMVAGSNTGKTDSEYTDLDELATAGEWYAIEPSSSGTYDVRCRVNSLPDGEDGVDEVMTVVVVDGVDPADPVDDASTFASRSNTGLHRTDLLTVEADQVALVGTHYFQPFEQAGVRNTDIPEDQLDFRFKKIADNDLDGAQQGHFVWGALNQGSTTYSLSAQFSVGPVTDRYHHTSTVYLKSGSAGSSSSSSTSSSVADRPTRVATVSSDVADDVSTTTPALTTESGDFLLAFSYCTGGTEEARDVEVTFAGNKFLEATGDVGEVSVTNDGTELKMWYLPVTAAIQTQTGGSGTVQVAAVDQSSTRASLGVAVIQFRSVDLNDPWVGSIVAGNRSDDETPSITYSPVADVDADIVLAGIWNDTSYTATADNTELWETGTGGIGFVGDTVDLDGSYADVALGYELTGGSGSGSGLPDNGLIVVSVRGGFGTGGEEFEDDFEVVPQSPANGSTNLGNSIELSWVGRYQDGRPLPEDLVYDVYLGIEGEATPQLVASGLTDTTYEAGRAFQRGVLPFGKTFRWRVVARLSNSPGFDGVTSDTFLFSTSADFGARRLEPGDYVFGYILYDSRTGRQSAFSEVAQARSEDFPVDPVNEGERQDQYAAIEILYDSDKFDQAWVYRSVKVQDAGGTLIARWQHLEAIIDLEEFHTNNNGEGTLLPSDEVYRQAVYYYTKEDKVLVWQEPYVDLPNYDSQMPKGGTALMYRNTMMVSKIASGDTSTTEENRENDAFAGLGELRWSSVPQVSPELFPPQNRYTPPVPSNEIIKLKSVGGNVLGFSNDRMYHIRREANGLQVREMHEGFLGLVNHKAVSVAGSMCYLVTTKGIKVVDAFAKLDHLHAFDYVIREEWKNSLDSVSVAYDPRASVIFFHNEELAHTLCIWMDTAMATELVDMNFREVRQGAWPSDLDDYGSPLTERAFFVQNAPADVDAGEATVGWKPRVFVMDDRRAKTVSGSEAGVRDGNRRLTLLAPTGETFLTVGSATSSSVTITDGDSIVGDYLEGCTIYLLDGENRGNKAVVLRKTLNDSDVILVTDRDLGASSGDTIAVSPVFCEVLLGPLSHGSVESQNQQVNDFHEVRQLDQLGCTFVDVEDSGRWGGPDPFYEGVVYRGTGETPEEAVVPTSEGRAAVESIREGERQYLVGFGEQTGYERRQGLTGVSLSPGIRTYYPDVDWRLLGIMVKGKLRPTQTRRAPSTGP